MIVVFGSVNADLIFRLDDLPQPGQTLIAREMVVEPGGKGANQAYAAARDGARTIMAGAVGADSLADTALAGLHDAGVDVARVAIAPGPTGCASICTDRHGRNQIAVASGANAAARAACIDDALLVPGTTVVTQMEVDPAQTAELIRRAHRAGARVVHNLAPAMPIERDALSAVDVLVVNEDEAAWLARDVRSSNADAGSLYEALRVTVVRTLGGAGVEWAGTDGSGRISAPVVEVVDTTAAGDCFVGVLAAALDRGDALANALRRANAAAALSCTRRGSQRSLPSRDEVDAAASRFS